MRDPAGQLSDCLHFLALAKQAFGALAFGIGTSEVEHVLATQTLPQMRPGTMAINVDGELPLGEAATLAQKGTEAVEPVAFESDRDRPRRPRGGKSEPRKFRPA